MSKEGYNQIIDEAYDNYRTAFVEGHVHQELNNCLPQEEFILEIKTDGEFSKTWDLKIEERELSERERIEMIQPFGMDALVPEVRKKWMEENNIPTKLITIKYKDKKIEVYE